MALGIDDWMTDVWGGGKSNGLVPQAGNGGFRTYDNSGYGAMDSYKMGDNGQMIKMDGWGMDAANLAIKGIGMFNDMNARDELLKQKKEEMEFGKEKYYKNLAMRLSNYRQFQNDRSNTLAHNDWVQGGRQGNFNDSAFYDNNRTVDRNGNVVSDPISLDGAQKYGVNVGGSSAMPNNTGAPSTAWNQSPATASSRLTQNANTGAGLSNFKPRRAGDQLKKKNESNVAKVTG